MKERRASRWRWYVAAGAVVAVVGGVLAAYLVWMRGEEAPLRASLFVHEIEEPPYDMSVVIEANAEVKTLRWRASPATVLARSSVPDGPIGTEHAMVRVAMSDDGGWVVVCQARADADGDGVIRVRSDGHHGSLSGDPMRPYLVIGSGAGTPIDDVAGYDATGRWVVVVVGDAVELVDTLSEGRTRLNRAATAERVVFDDHGGRVAYVRDGDLGREVILRELSSGRERRIDHGPGLLWRMELYDAWLVFHVVGQDTNESGRLEPPTFGDNRAPGPCRGPPSAMSTFGSRVDRFEGRVVELSEAEALPAARHVPGLIRPFGNGLLRRNGDGAIFLQVGEGVARLVEPECRGWLREVDPARDLLVVGCLGRAEPTVELYRPRRTHLTVRGHGAQHDGWTRPPQRLLELHNEDVVIDTYAKVFDRIASAKWATGPYVVDDHGFYRILDGHRRPVPPLPLLVGVSETGAVLTASECHCGSECEVHPSIGCGPARWVP